MTVYVYVSVAISTYYDLNVQGIVLYQPIDICDTNFVAASGSLRLLGHILP